ncbi:hypothetical protein KIL84_005650 [Mauremys mutica]|uniref:Uncharacterized protein n=1 Tax=Mauremys mutica TaxID=74926 RepID=A0A9D3XIC3_9SAUR|nr:hypothetical protein KIL84_005650 [Mauremys mutica]
MPGAAPQGSRGHSLGSVPVARGRTGLAFPEVGFARWLSIKISQATGRHQPSSCRQRQPWAAMEEWGGRGELERSWPVSAIPQPGRPAGVKRPPAPVGVFAWGDSAGNCTFEQLWRPCREDEAVQAAA